MRNSMGSAADYPSSPLRCAFDVVNGSLFVAMLVVGIVRWNMCPIEPFIPKALMGEQIEGT